MIGGMVIDWRMLIDWRESGMVIDWQEWNAWWQEQQDPSMKIALMMIDFSWSKGEDERVANKYG